MLNQRSWLIYGLMLFAFTLASCSSEPVRKTHADSQEPAPTQSKENLINKAQALYSHNDLKGARQILDSIAVSEIDTRETSKYWNLRGLVELASKHPENAAKNFRSAIEENQVPEYRSYYQYNLATALLDQKKYSESFDMLNSIDLGSIDPTQQQKVLALKEKVSQANTIDKKKPVTTTTISGSPGAVGTGIGTAVFTQPTEIYGGPVERKKIGLLIPLTGKFEAFGKKVRHSVELAFQHSSDLAAKDYEIVAEDSGDSPDSQMQALVKLVEVDKVIGVIGPVISKGIDELAKKASFYQVPLISLAQVQGPLTSSLFFCSVSTKDQVSQLVKYAMEKKGFLKFAVIAPSVVL